MTAEPEDLTVPSERGSARNSAISKPHRSRGALALAALVGAGVLLAGCNLPAYGAHHGSTTQGHDTFKLWQGDVTAAIVVGLIVYGLIFWSVFRYRRKRSDNSMPRQFHDHPKLEIVYTIIPLIMVLVIFYFAVLTENNVDAVSSHPDLTVKVTAFQWGWKFHYLGKGVEVIGNTQHYPQMVLPVDQPVKIILVSADVVHGFYVPKFDFSRYAQPGVVNLFDLNVRHVGVYRGQCSEFCGLYHSEMIFSVKAIPDSQFPAWLAQARTTSPSHLLPGAPVTPVPPNVTPRLSTQVP
ncbi:MAG: cytochrome c oxidase subunit II [Actinobacteria bacterium]|nr:cytochrome c oxidase subunit II [Actinomycetota bacterium]